MQLCRLRETTALISAAVFTSNGVHTRLLTYQLRAAGSVAFMQMGKVLVEEDRIKHRLLLILFAAGIAFTIVSGGASWWLSGRSLRSTRFMWEQQQTFVANASHELRTPLTLIRASTQVLQLSFEPSDLQRQLLDDVINETDYMSRLVDDMLVLSRLDAGQLQLDTSTIELSELFPKIVRPFASLARERGVDVGLVRAEGVVFADSIRLWQVLLIVLDNALRHTPAGGRITLESEVRDQTVQITVADTGNGIDPADLPHVFERFYKADTSRGDRHSAGLGLSIAKPLVVLHGGELTIQSTRGVGTLAIITLPAQLGPPIPEVSRISRAPRFKADHRHTRHGSMLMIKQHRASYMQKITRRRFLRHAAVAGGIGVFSHANGRYKITLGQEPVVYKLRVLHTNDHHGRIEPVSIAIRNAPEPAIAREFGGVARRKALIDQVLATAAPDENVVLLDAGDVFQGTLYFTQYSGQADLHFYNGMNYHAVAVGNHEFDKGQATLRDFVLNANFPLLSANLYVEPSAVLAAAVAPTDIATPGRLGKRVIIAKGGKKIGLFGLTPPTTSILSNAGAGVTFGSNLANRRANASRCTGGRGCELHHRTDAHRLCRRYSARRTGARHRPHCRRTLTLRRSCRYRPAHRLAWRRRARTLPSSGIRMARTSLSPPTGNGEHGWAISPSDSMPKAWYR